MESKRDNRVRSGKNNKVNTTNMDNHSKINANGKNNMNYINDKNNKSDNIDKYNKNNKNDNIENLPADGSFSSTSSIDRRKRVNRIKTVIVILVIIFMVLHTLFCIVLGIQVIHLQRQINEISKTNSDYDLSYEVNHNEAYAYAAQKPSGANEHKSALNSTGGMNNSLDPAKGQDSVIPQQAGISDNSLSYNNQLSHQVDNDQTDNEPADNNQLEQPDAVQTKESPKVSTTDPKQHNEVKEQNETIEKPDYSTGAFVTDDSADGNNQHTDGIYAGKKVYLTFDDGPSNYTEDILDILNEYNIKATFFVIGKTDDASIDTYKRIVNEGHTLGMHSYSHKYKKIYNSLEDFDKDFTKLWKLLYDTTGYKPSIYRFPGGSDNLVNKNGMNDFIKYLNDKSIVYYDWNVVNGDATGAEYTLDQLIDNILGGVAVKDRSIVLMHDSQAKKTTVDSLAGLLEELIEGGAQVLPLDKDVSPIQMIKADSIK